MTTQYLDNFFHDLVAFVSREAGAFEGKYGRTAREFLVLLPGVFQVLRRVSIDVEIDAHVRKRTALAALYLVEAHDFMPVASAGPHGVIDDVWVAFATLAFLDDAIDDERMRLHWRGEGSFDDAIALAHNVSAIQPLVPSRVLEMVCAYLNEGG